MAKKGKDQDKNEKYMDRLLIMLGMIPRREFIKTKEIASRLKAEHNIEISLRTIQRDLVNLSRNYTLITDDNKSAGWSWMEGTPLLDIPVMDPPVALTFRLMRDYMAHLLPRAILATLDGYFRAADDRLNKLPNSTLSHWADKVRVVSRSLSFTPPRVHESILDSLYKALQLELCFELDYCARSGKEKTYLVNPLGLVFVNNLIYLVATLNDHTDPIQLLAHRMKSIRLLPDQPATTPDGFTLQGYIDSGEFGYPLGGKIPLKVLFDKGAAPYLYETKLVPNQKLTEQTDGKLLLEAVVQDDVQLRWWLKGLGEKVEILEPADLRNEFATMASKMAEKYHQITK